MTTAEDDPDEVMCTCTGTTRGAILRMFAQGLDIEAISRKSGALSGCGGCEYDIETLLQALALQQQASQGE
ncbi:MAG: (2Fe-2S)-binding protein [Methylophilus sp.]|jgi:NAD(P)H-nitrite reductase large subunit